MRAPTLVKQITRVHVLIVAFSCSLLVAGTMMATAWLLRRDQDALLRTRATMLCRTIALEKQEDGSDDLAAAREAFREGAIDGYRLEFLLGDVVRVAQGELPEWTADASRSLGTVECGSVNRGERWGDGLVYRACADSCGVGQSVRVVTQDVLFQTAVRRAALGILGALPLAVLAGAIAGIVVFRRRLRPLEDLRRAAARLEARPGLALGVGARPAELAGVERAFDSLLDRLGEALAREKRFTQEASHELRTPLTILRGRLDHLCRLLEERPELRTEVDGALADLKSLDRLVEALLLLARSESAGLPTTPVNLCDLAREMAREGARDESGASREPEVEAPDEILVRGSEELLKRALGNLVENSLKFAGREARVRIRVFQRDGHGVISVEDDGPGILPELRPLVFERFVRGPADRNRLPGVGLGLAVVRAIVVRHGGEVTTGPSSLGGEEVRLSLPLLSAGWRS